MRLAAEAKPRDEGKSEDGFFHGDQLTEVGWFLNESALSLPPPPEICQEDNGGGMQHVRNNPISVAIPLLFGKTQLPHHPSGTSSAGTTSPEYREIGLAGFESQIVVTH